MTFLASKIGVEKIEKMYSSSVKDAELLSVYSRRQFSGLGGTL